VISPIKGEPTTRRSASQGSLEGFTFCDRERFSNIVQVSDPAAAEFNCFCAEGLALPVTCQHLFEAATERLVDKSRNLTMMNTREPESRAGWPP
jgi:hypothetical protein